MKKIFILISLLFIAVSCSNNVENNSIIEEKEIKVEFKEDISSIKSIVDLEKDYDTAIKSFQELLKENPEHEGLKDGLETIKKTSELDERKVFSKIDNLINLEKIDEAELYINKFIKEYPDHQGFKAALRDLDNYRK